jgi:hypothetical protein
VGWGAVRAGRSRLGRVRPLRVAASFLLVSGAVTVLVAAQLPTLSPSAVADTPPSAPGSAFASAVVLGLNPQYGGLSLVVRGGQSTASYTGSQAVADSQAVNLGYIGGLLNGPPNACYGSTGPSPTAAFNALQVASASGASTMSADGGVEAVTVNPSPESAGSTTDLTPIAVPQLFTITAHSMAHVSYTANQAQQANATTTMTVALLGGVVSLNGLSWSVTQDTGLSDVATATFSMTSVTIAGKTTPIATPAELAAAFTTVNKVLAVAGLSLVPPAASTDAVTGAVTIGPLRLQVLGTSLTNTVLGALNPTETTLEQQIGKILGANDSACFKVLAGYVGDSELVAGLVEGILAGGGVIDLDLGGANADTEAAPNYTNPLGAGITALGGSGSGQSLPSLGSASSSFLPGPGGAAATAPTTAAPKHTSTAATGPLALVHCVTSSPADRPGCWSGAATWGAVALLVVGGSLFAADVIRSRRRLNRPKETL